MAETLVRLSGVRQFTEREFSLRSPTVIVGPNGVGKTTILEAIYYASLGRSYRTTTDRDLIGWQTDTARIELVTPAHVQVKRAISTFGGSLAKQVEVNGQPTTPLASLGHVHVVLFAPELIELLTGSPRVRRRYLDTLLAATNRQYAHALLTYQHALKQRNALLLDQRSQPTSFEVWETLLVETGARIIADRQDLVRILGDHVQPAYDQLEATATPRTMHLTYQATIDPVARYEDVLATSRERDRRSGGTSVGPHRDDLICSLGDRPLSFASRGEQRSFLLALKYAEVARYTRDPATPLPYLLLDDLFSELDQRRAAHLTDLLANYPTVVTTTDATQLDDRLRDQALVVDLADA